MKKANTISKHINSGKTLDYDFLFNEAIRYLQNLSGDTWTDYNLHDPGLTILEYLCYALTDLAYRTDIDIEQVVYAKPDIVTQQALFQPAIVFPSGPVTDNDLRRLIISQNTEVQNCWIETDITSGSYFQLKNIYLLSASVDLPTASLESKAQQLKNRVRKTVMANRGLGEDFGEIIILERQPVYVSALLTIQESYKPEDVMVSVLMAIEGLLNPAVLHETNQNSNAKNRALSKDFEGPKQSKRVIPESALRDKKNELNWSEVQDLLLKLEGVLRVEELTLKTASGQPAQIIGNSQILKIEKDKYFYLDLGFLNQIMTQKGIKLKRYHRTIDLDTIEIKGRFNFNKNRKYRYHPLDSKKQKENTQSNYHIQQLAQYTSIQNLFPNIYGLGKWGLPTNATAAHRLHSKQLKGFLLLFEHFFSSYLAELSELPFLYCISSNEEIAKRKRENSALKYFPFNVPDVDELLLEEGSNEIDKRHVVADKYKALYLKSNDFFERKNTILNHLLARFSESFDDRFHRRIYQDLDGDAYQWQLIDDKKRFLRGLKDGGYERGFGFNYKELKQSIFQNVSGFKKLICLKLGFPSFENSPLTNSVMTGGIIQIGKTLQNTEETDSAMNQGIGLRNLLYYGGERQNYFIIWNEQKSVYDVLLKTPSVTQFVYHDRIRNECEKAIIKLQREIAEINRLSLGFYMVEHILLRPEIKQQKLKYNLRKQFAYTTNCTLHLKGSHRSPLVLKSKPYQNNTNILGNLDLALLKYGTQLENWEETPDGHGRYRLKLLGKRKEWVFKSPNSFPNYDSDDSEAVRNSPKQLVYQYLIGLDPKTARITLKHALVIVQEEMNDKTEIDITEFYQERISFLFPSWVNHFFTKDRRNYLENIIRTYLPAHLTPCFYWLTFKDMTAFQEHFEDWQIQLSMQTDDAPNKTHQLAIREFLHKKFAEDKLRRS